MKEETKEMLEIFRQLSKEGQMRSIFHAGTILKAENAMRRQYGLLSEGSSGQQTHQAEAGVRG